MQKAEYGVGILGLGTVGSTVARFLTAPQTLNTPLFQIHSRTRLKAVCARDQSRDRGFSMEGVDWYTDANSLVNDNGIDVVVELIGGADGAALSAVELALSQGKSVVTANKAMLAKHGQHLSSLAEANGVHLCFEAAIAGGIPILQSLRRTLAASSVYRVQGILNGTCNYILSQMEQTGADFASALQGAQDLGFAEADPAMDIDASDSTQKLAILGGLGFGVFTPWQSISRTGIEQIMAADFELGRHLGYRLRLIAEAEYRDGQLAAHVSPMFLDQHAPLARAVGADNAIMVSADLYGELAMHGPGAGGVPTAMAVMQDIMECIIGAALLPFGRPANSVTNVAPELLFFSKRQAVLRMIGNDGPMRPAAGLSNLFNVLDEQGIEYEPINLPDCENRLEAWMLSGVDSNNMQMIKQLLNEPQAGVGNAAWLLIPLQ